MTGIDVVREPARLAGADPIFKRYLDETLKLANTRD
jgi:hypothetical protein